jgi:succinoglycan biosynthesis protein ExoO
MSCVSVIIPAYNAAEFIVEAYRSVVDQTLDDWEAIFVNDGSQDDTLTVVRSFATADKRVRVIDLPINSGPAHARNAALAIAEGDWIAVLDADDRYSPDRLEVLTCAGAQIGADVVLDNQFVVDPISGRTIFLAFVPTKDDLKVLEFSEFLQTTQSNTFFDFGYLKPIIRRRWLMANNIKYLEELRHGEDLMLLFECFACRAHVTLLSTPHYYYCLQYSQSSRTKSPRTRTEIREEPLLAAIEQFTERHDATLSRLERHLVRSCCESLREDKMVASFRSCLEHLDIVGLGRGLRHPIRLLRGIYYAKRRSLLHRQRRERFRGLEAT